MRTEDFTLFVKKCALEQANYLCERRWTINNLEFHHKTSISNGGGSTIENCIVLCHNCHNIAPKDLFLLDNYFLRFSSVKEMIKHYNVNNEDEAIRLFSKEIGIEYEVMKKRIEEDSKSHIDTIKQGMKKRVKEIGHSGFNIPFGYHYYNGILKKNSKEEKVVKDIVRWYLEGKSLSEIVKMLNSGNIRSKRGGLWAKKTISTILKNPVYCGYHRFEGKITEGRHKKIIDEMTFNKVQNLIGKMGGRPNFYNFR